MISGISSLTSLLERSGSGSVLSTSSSSNIQSTALSQPANMIESPSFSDMMSQIGSNAVDVIKQGEAASIANMRGELGTRETVESILSAERNMQIAVAMREKFISSYQEITRMTI